MARLLRLIGIAALLAFAAAIPIANQHGRHGAGRATSPARVAQLRAAAAAAVASGFASFEADVNILHLTDVHSWLSGHMHEPDDEADYPDLLAFYQHLEKMAHAKVSVTLPATPCLCYGASLYCVRAAGPVEHAGLVSLSGSLTALVSRLDLTIFRARTSSSLIAATW